MLLVMYTWYRDTPSPLVTSVHSPVKNELMSFFKSFFFFYMVYSYLMVLSLQGLLHFWHLFPLWTQPG